MTKPAPTLPAAGRPTFELADGEIEIGFGIHGEPGQNRGPLETAYEVTSRLVSAIVTDLHLTSGDDVAVMISGPSTMAALVGAGLLAASKDVMDEDSWTPQIAEQIGRVATARISKRGKAELGDKTVLDALSPSLDALHAAAEGIALTNMIAAATAGRDATTNQAARRGRAAWVGDRDRGNGHPDPGATAYVLFLIALRNANP